MTTAAVAAPTPEQIKAMATPEIIERYNTFAAKLGFPKVQRFSDRKTAETRLKRIITESQIEKPERTVRQGPAPKKAKAAKANGAAKTPHPAIKSVTSTDHKTTPVTKAKAAPAKPGEPKAYRDKLREAGKVAYEPRDGSVQAAALAVLRKAGDKGVEVNKMCEELNAVRRGSKPITLATLWTELTYILCDKRGFGLEAKAGRLYLKEPRDVRKGA